MAAPGLVNFSGLMDDAKCFAFVRQHRWPEGVWCPGCGGSAVMDFGPPSSASRPRHLPTYGRRDQTRRG